MINYFYKTTSDIRDRIRLPTIPSLSKGKDYG